MLTTPQLPRKLENKVAEVVSYALIGIVAFLVTVIVIGMAFGSGKSTAGASAPYTQPVPATSAPATAPATDTLTAFGATDAGWNANHVEDTRGNIIPGAAYDPIPSDGDLVYADRYYAVLHENGRVLNYSMAFGRGTPQGVATATVMQEFPWDVHVLWTIRRDTCYKMEIVSSDLGRALADPKIGDPTGEVTVEFASDEDTQGNSSYSASSVREVMLGLGSYPTANDSPGC